MDNNLDIIKYVGDNNVLVAKHHIQNFNTKSQLIVNESQEALFYKDGQALDLFPSGRHSLNTDNIPVFKKLFSKLFGGQTPFDCEVFFINKVFALDLVWGTDTPINLIDPEVDLPIGVRANGQTGIRVIDSRKFVVKVVGQLQEFTVESVKRAIKGAMMLSIKDCIAKTIVNNKVGILEISARLRELSEVIKVEINKDIADLGLEMVHFYVNQIAAHPDDLLALKESKRKILEARTQAEMRRVQGYSYQDEKQFEVLKEAAANKGIGGTFVSAGVGFGMGAAVGQQMGHTAQAMQQQPQQTNTIVCSECQGQINAGAKFCPNCGKPVVPQKKFCIECGTELTPTAKFCSSCGAKQ